MNIFRGLFSKKAAPDIEKIKQRLQEIAENSKKPIGAAASAARGAKTRWQLMRLIEEVEDETDQPAMTKHTSSGFSFAGEKSSASSLTVPDFSTNRSPRPYPIL